ncbi:alpha-1,4-glucan--maltose-1-phosphate maltosyltransferase [Actinomycetospora sp. NBRC 106378]|uniref:alpha-1,4-glucan--maltose-1-phosphate maltosyltransferase n=1 Tax=Actinomycetospora sp. NBRC 106378 TaxID=3032208 RepID=UPI002554C162|nr:alpha-1,4-glucan--maltose-1-phosphate maltosyltransferase [Actinomycetospora sp. NBRC 106378]
MGIDEVTPEVSGGRFPSKAVVGEVVPVTATVWREGHDAIAATLVWQRCADVDHADAEAVATAPVVGHERSVRMVSLGKDTDRAAASLVADAEGLWRFRVDAWSDPWATWRHAVEVKVAAGQGPGELANDLESGARLLERGAAQIEDRSSADEVAHQPAGEATTPLEMPPSFTFATRLREAAASLRDTDKPLVERLARALSEPVAQTMTERPVRELITRGADHHVLVERPRALDGTWYEFFPRSTGGWDADGRPVHGTFHTAQRELERAAAMGFDVVYLPPIHPIGTVNRKGPNNTLTPGPEDVGSPWAIGSADGGHDAVHPQLGTIDDFDAFVARAKELDLEVALDFALQCAPDHPWAATHPEWFTVRPDGTIAYAENPPKKYQDIYPVNFDTDPAGIYAESLRVVLYWLSHGVRVFRVDNPHTKPADFWSWLIAKVHEVDPGVVFLAEAFTRPARLFGLAKAGFSQSYTYFTWRTGRDELREFFEMHRDRIDEARPNCFVNTPDILHESLQTGGPGMFAIRATLAAMLAPSWGVYAGFELFEWQPVRSGSEEYLDSEKYQLRPRDFDRALAEGRSLQPWITRLNEIRRAHPAVRQLRTLRFHDTDNEALLAWSKTDPITGDTVLGVVNLNPFGAEEGTVHLDMAALGLDPFARFGAFDEVSGQVFDWGQANFVRLEPWRDVAHLVSVQKR